jgi:tRNA nucleotidyltransferase/poly(A) polymerase
MSDSSNMNGLAQLLARPPVRQALALLNDAKDETRIVGGAVRNALLDMPINDLDLATTLLPQEVMARAAKAGVRALPTGIEHGTITLLIDGLPFETTTLRDDVLTDGRHAQVLFGRDFLADAQRRDFTINAMSLTKDGALHDPLGGAADLSAGRVRFIGDPAQRIREDYLRVLRFFRFSAAYATGKMDEPGFAASIAAREHLRQLSAERVRTELLKWLTQKRAVETVREAAEAGFFETLTGAMAYPARLAQLIACHKDADALLRLAALSCRVQEDAGQLRAQLRLSNAEERRLTLALAAFERLHGMGAAPVGARLGGLVIEYGATAVEDALKLAQAEASPLERAAYMRALGQLSHYAGLKLPVTGDDFKRRGVSEGRRIGLALKALQALWIRANFPKDSETLSRLIDEAIIRADQHIEKHLKETAPVSQA